MQTGGMQQDLSELCVRDCGAFSTEHSGCSGKLRAACPAQHGHPDNHAMLLPGGDKQQQAIADCNPEGPWLTTESLQNQQLASPYQ
jgi:hypothetical protein